MSLVSIVDKPISALLSRNEQEKVKNDLGYRFNQNCFSLRWLGNIQCYLNGIINDAPLTYHIAGVWAWACKLGLREGADLLVITVAAMFHDCMKGKVPFDQHAIASAVTFTEYIRDVECPLPGPFPAGRIVHCIESHNWAWINGSPKPGTPEAVILADADMLAQLGPTGILKHIEKYREFHYPQRIQDSKNDLRKALATIQGEYAKKQGKIRFKAVERFLNGAKYGL